MIDLLRDGYDKESLSFLINGFTDALLWQDESLDGYCKDDISYSLQDKINQYCSVFYALVLADETMTEACEDHSWVMVGHDLALESLGHGVGFWEQQSTQCLSNLLQFCIDKKVLIPFNVCYDSDINKLNWDSM